MTSLPSNNGPAFNSPERAVATDTSPASVSDSAMPVEMPAAREQAARDIARAGVEGRPADAKAGPGLLRLEMLAALAGLVLLSVGFGLWLGWGMGATTLVVGMLALLFNPVLGATALRAAERQKVAEIEKTQSDGGRSPPK